MAVDVVLTIHPDADWITVSDAEYLDLLRQGLILRYRAGGVIGEPDPFSARQRLALSAAVGAVVGNAPTNFDTLEEAAAAYGGLAEVARTGQYAALAGKPSIPSTPGAVGAEPAGLSTDTRTSLATTYRPQLAVLPTATTAIAATAGSTQPYNASGAALSPALPALSGLTVGATLLGVQKAIADTSANAVSVTCAGGDTFDSGASALVLRVAGELRELQVVSIGGTKYWKVIGGNTPLSALALAPQASRNALTGWFHPEAFGAKGDGATDDTASIQQAIDACAADGGGVVRLAKGTYVVTSLVLKQGVTLRSEVHQFQYTAPAHVTIKSNTAGATVIDTPTTGITTPVVEGITVLGGNTASIGIRFRDVSWGAIRRCQVQGFQDQGILQDAGIQINLEDILLIQTLLNQNRSTAAGAVEISGTDAYVRAVEASCSQTAKSTGSAETSAFLVKGNGNFFSQCVGEFADHAFTVTGRFNAFTGCRGDLSFSHGWQVLTGAQSGKNSFAGCVAWDNGRAATNTYAGFYVTSLGNVFSGCRPSQDGSSTWNATHKYAFWDASAPTSMDQRNEYVGCTGDYSTAMFYTGGIEADSAWPRQVSVFTSNAAQTYTPPLGAKYLEVIAIGGGGAGGGGGAAASNSGVATQVGGGGGASGVAVSTIVPAVTLSIVAGYGGIATAGGAAGGGAGGTGGSGGSSTVTGTGVAITASGGKGGAGGAANSTSATGGGQYGYAGTGNTQGPGTGGFASPGVGAGGGGVPGAGGGGGGGGAPASSTAGGVAGNAGTTGAGGGTASGQGGTTTGTAGATAGASAYGAGGGGGGGGAPGGAGGAGGGGGAGIVYVRVIA